VARPRVRQVGRLRSRITMTDAGTLTSREDWAIATPSAGAYHNKSQQGQGFWTPSRDRPSIGERPWLRKFARHSQAGERHWQGRSSGRGRRPTVGSARNSRAEQSSVITQAARHSCGSFKDRTIMDADAAGGKRLDKQRQAGLRAEVSVRYAGIKTKEGRRHCVFRLNKSAYSISY